MSILEIRGYGPYATECTSCGGTGTLMYGSTATWNKNGFGGAGMTLDVCDKCWGSGTNQPWPSHLEFYKMKRKLANLGELDSDQVVTGNDLKNITSDDP